MLKNSDYQVIAECLHALVAGPFFDREDVHTLTGLHKKQISKVLDEWPFVDFNDQVVHLAVNNTLANLWAYPHGCDDVWNDYISVSPEEMYEVLKRWKNRFNP